MRYFFITCLGRSGSAFLADLLNQDPDARVEHEPFRDDYLHLPLAYYGGAHRCVRDYIRSRRERIEARVHDSVAIYGEVNSLLRYFTDDIREVFDDPPLMFIVRNGRRYVESAYVRGIYSAEATHAHIVPKDDDPWVDHWKEFGRFEKLCWYWSHTNAHLLAKVERFTRLEDLVRDYGALREHVLVPTGVSISEEAHRRSAERPRNTTADFVRMRFRERLRLPWRRSASPAGRPLGPWTEAMEQSFQAICGETMRRLGYPA